MIIVLDLSKVEPGLYRADLTQGGVAVTEPTFHTRLADALREAAASVPADFAKFLEPRYAGCTTGTISCEQLSLQAEQVADRLVALLAQLHQANES